MGNFFLDCGRIDGRMLLVVLKMGRGGRGQKNEGNVEARVSGLMKEALEAAVEAGEKIENEAEMFEHMRE